MITATLITAITLTLNPHYLNSDRVPELERQYDAAVERHDVVEQERLGTLLWQEGDPEILFVLADIANARGDYIDAYAKMYALNELAKFNAKRLPPEGKVRGPQFAAIQKVLNDLGKKLTPGERRAAVWLAEQLIVNNAQNCCIPM